MICFRFAGIIVVKLVDCGEKVHGRHCCCWAEVLMPYGSEMPVE